MSDSTDYRARHQERKGEAIARLLWKNAELFCLPRTAEITKKVVRWTPGLRLKAAQAAGVHASSRGEQPPSQETWNQVIRFLAEFVADEARAEAVAS